MRAAAHETEANNHSCVGCESPCRREWRFPKNALLPKVNAKQQEEGSGKQERKRDTLDKDEKSNSNCCARAWCRLLLMRMQMRGTLEQTPRAQIRTILPLQSITFVCAHIQYGKDHGSRELQSKTQSSAGHIEPCLIANAQTS